MLALSNETIANFVGGMLYCLKTINNIKEEMLLHRHHVGLN